MSQRQFDRFRDKIRQLNAFLHLADSDPELHDRLVRCSSHDEVVAIARSRGFVINKRWSDPFDDELGRDNEPTG